MREFILILLIIVGWCDVSFGQIDVRQDTGVTNEVRIIYRKAADFLASTQQEDGSWNEGMDGDRPAISALAVMAFLSTGEDPNFGKYAKNVRAALRFIISRQNPNTGFIRESMYVHGFSMLALSEAYGAVLDELIWSEGQAVGEKRSLAAALELAVRSAVTAQQRNPSRAWRYGPIDQTADTSVSGAVLMGLLAARNAGINVPQEAIDNALNYMRGMTSPDSGMVGYADLMIDDSAARSAIACLVFCIDKKSEWDECKATRQYLVQLAESDRELSNPEYQRYYMAQALFQADYDAWKKWNSKMISQFQEMQTIQGQIGSSQYGSAYSTSMAMLALALNYKFLPIYER